MAAWATAGLGWRDVVNEYSDDWFSFFLETIPPADSETEVAFLLRHLPLPDYRRVVDLCCGSGRHARRLAGHGYEVLGVDKSAIALAKAELEKAINVTYVQQDMRSVAELPGTYDAFINLWHSFGYFDDSTNRDIVRQIQEKLNPGGRLIMDVYNRECLRNFPESRSLEKRGVSIAATHSWRGDRLSVELSYGSTGGADDSFDWQLYTPEEMIDLASDAGFDCLISCATFDESLAPSAEHTRMQFVLRKRAPAPDA